MDHADNLSNGLNRAPAGKYRRGQVGLALGVELCGELSHKAWVGDDIAVNASSTVSIFVIAREEENRKAIPRKTRDLPNLVAISGRAEGDCKTDCNGDFESLDSFPPSQTLKSRNALALCSGVQSQLFRVDAGFIVRLRVLMR